MAKRPEDGLAAGRELDEQAAWRRDRIAQLAVLRSRLSGIQGELDAMRSLDQARRGEDGLLARYGELGQTLDDLQRELLAMLDDQGRRLDYDQIGRRIVERIEGRKRMELARINGD